MIHALDPLREFNFWTVLLRLFLALVSGAVIGYGRSKKDRNAGFRTYILISVGAAMAVLLTLYLNALRDWSKFDASRLASQVVTGIGFLGAGIIVKAAHHQVQGLTTATGLFSTVCMSLAAGAGFYELVVIALITIVVVLNVMWPLETLYKRRLRNITLNVEFNSVDDLNEIADTIRARDASVYEIDVERTERIGDKYPSAIFILQLSKTDHSHSAMLSSIAELGCVQSVQELIS